PEWLSDPCPPNRKDPNMYRHVKCWLLGSALIGLALAPAAARAACCYFSAKDADVLQPAQKAFITWDARAGMETFTVQPRFEGNARDFGMVIPTPSRPKLDEMPRDFFKELAVYTILKRRVQPQSRLVVEYPKRNREAKKSDDSDRDDG